MAFRKRRGRLKRSRYEGGSSIKGTLYQEVFTSERGYLKTNVASDSTTGAKQSSGIWNLESVHTALSEFVPAGEHVFTLAGTTIDWVVPEKVTSVCILCVGGGEGGGVRYGGDGGSLSYINDVPVTPGETLQVRAGFYGEGANTTSSAAGTNGEDSYVSRSGTYIAHAYGGPAAGSSVVSAVAYGGGSGSSGAYIQGTYGAVYNGGGGGGAGGYSGAGGNGSYTTGMPGTGGGGGGGASWTTVGNNATTAYSYGRRGSAGGGVGIYGEGESGAGGSLNVSGNGGSGGSIAATYYHGGDYGGGGAGGFSRAGGITGSYVGGNGAQGAVRIIWGEGRAFPSTNVDEASSDSNISTN